MPPTRSEDVKPYRLYVTVYHVGPVYVSTFGLYPWPHLTTTNARSGTFSFGLS